MDVEADKLAKDYANYLVVNVKDDVKSLEDVIDDTLTRLDEFSGLVDLVSDQMNPETAAHILSRKGELLALFQRVTKLELTISQVRQTVDTFDHLVATAETTLNATTEGKIKNFLKPLFRKKSSTSATSPPEAVSPEFSSPPIFDTKYFFPHSET